MATTTTTTTLTVPTKVELKDLVDESLEKLTQELWEVNHQIWSNPELGFQEHKAHDTICDFLEKQGFSVTRHAYGIPTAFEARSGQGGRLVGFNAEYDALPNIGHACGHNLIATSGLAGFLALSHTLKMQNIPGRTQLLGTPAEESGGGKIKLLQAGAYNGVDVTLMAHGGTNNMKNFGAGHGGVGGVRMVAREQFFCEFKGKNAHAGANPWDGHNALDAFVASYNNVSLLRQQILDTDRIHSAITESPKAANIIAAATKATFVTRSETLKSLKALSEKLIACIEAGASATGCEVSIEREAHYADMVINEALCRRWQARMAEYGRNVLVSIPTPVSASSDFGNVSYAMPGLHPIFTIPASEGSSPHHASFTSAAGTREAHDIAVTVGKALALVGWDVLTDDEVFEASKSEWFGKMAAEGVA
ncbi:amidohydrolase [Exophiala viscosa]|uniref:amidohydrolase n=1 Tax=Exophiala viscosa TaxID=2486360 RepID=UPI0021987D5E|nr:amidohydrolase [Exophiala viscosa]